MYNQLNSFLRNVKHNLCQLSGEDAYERYLMRFAEHQKLHALENDDLNHATMPLSRKDFFKQWQDGKWTGIKRCC